MDAELKKKWVGALRSGKFRQARENLQVVTNKRHSYCCLGVLARVAGEKVDDVREGTGALSQSFRRRVGLTSRSEDKLIGLNDGNEQPFSMIADWIEAHL